MARGPDSKAVQANGAKSTTADQPAAPADGVDRLTEQPESLPDYEPEESDSPANPTADGAPTEGES